MKGQYRQNAFWATVNKRFISPGSTSDLRHFKSEAMNFKYAYWDPKTNGVRYFKDLLFNLAIKLDASQLQKISRVSNGLFGDPITVNIHGHKVDMDLLLSLYESEFIQKNVNLKHASVLEVGAGYGRTAHFLLSHYQIDRYFIVDLEESLNISRRYLRKVLPKNMYARIEFVSVSDFTKLGEHEQFDLAINANSFAEMEPAVVKNYLKYIAGHSRFFYVRNPVGKYLDKSLDAHHRGNAAVRQALRSGPIRDIIDIYDEQAVRKQALKFTKAYHPSPSWSLLASAWAPPWSFYWQGIYRRNSPHA